VASESIAVIFDGDDTLWSTELLYDHARTLARNEIERAGLDGGEWEALERRIDVENVGVLGFSTDRFPTSCVQAYEVLCQGDGRTPDLDVVQRVRVAARTVFSERPLLVPHAKEILETLRSRGVKLALLTKGDRNLQTFRIQQSGLAECFDVVKIVDEKDPEAFLKIVAAVEAERGHSWSVGNSVRSDILPAISAGLRAVWIDAHVWEHERSVERVVHDRVFTVADISELLQLIVEGNNEETHGLPLPGTSS
jgi:putative hydrolase of the HAD superfamily